MVLTFIKKTENETLNPQKHCIVSEVNERPQESKTKRAFPPSSLLPTSAAAAAAAALFVNVSQSDANVLLPPPPSHRDAVSWISPRGIRDCLPMSKTSHSSGPLRRDPCYKMTFLSGKIDTACVEVEGECHSMWVFLLHFATNHPRSSLAPPLSPQSCFCQFSYPPSLPELERGKREGSLPPPPPPLRTDEMMLGHSPPPPPPPRLPPTTIHTRLLGSPVRSWFVPRPAAEERSLPPSLYTLSTQIHRMSYCLHIRRFLRRWIFGCWAEEGRDTRPCFGGGDFCTMLRGKKDKHGTRLPRGHKSQVDSRRNGISGGQRNQRKKKLLASRVCGN